MQRTAEVGVFPTWIRNAAGSASRLPPWHWGLLLLGVAVWSYGRGAEDWRRELDGLWEDPLYLRSPGLGIVVNVVLSALVGGLALLARARAGRSVAGPAPGARTVRWRWWWLLVAGRGGYLTGGAVVIAGGGSVSSLGTEQIEVGAPLAWTADLPATCHSVVGRPDLIAEVDLLDHLMPEIVLYDRTTGDEAGPYGPGVAAGPGRIMVSILRLPPSLVPDRPAPYMEWTDANGRTVKTPPVSFLDAYGYSVTRFEASGRAGRAELKAIGFESLTEGPRSPSVRVMNLVIPDDPWPETFTLKLAWTCERASS